MVEAHEKVMAITQGKFHSDPQRWNLTRMRSISKKRKVSSSEEDDDQRGKAAAAAAEARSAAGLENERN